MRILKLTFAIGLGGFAASPAYAAGLPQLDPSTYSAQVVWLVVTFVLLYVLMAKVALPRIGDVLEERQNKIDDNLAKAEELKVQAEAAQEAYESSLAQARAKAHDAIREVKDNAAAEAAERQSALNDQLQAKIRESEQAITKARDEALAGITEVATEVASGVVEKLIGDAPKEASVNGAVLAALKDRA